MLLSEVLNKPISGIKTSRVSHPGITVNSAHSVIGTGGQTIATLHKKFPGKVIKTIQIEGNDDPIYQYLRLILRHQDNPYFPKIYSVKQYNTHPMRYREHQDLYGMIDPDDIHGPAPSQLKKTLIVVTEKLYPLKGITQADLERFGFEDVVLPDRLKQATRAPAIKFREAFLHPKYRQRAMMLTQDPKLKQALRLMEPLFRHFSADMHDANIMTRANGQWVFVDPITYNTESEPEWSYIDKKWKE